MAGLDPAIPLSKARLCLITGIAGSSPAMTEVGNAPYLNISASRFASAGGVL
jgi:hypothetical protein